MGVRVPARARQHHRSGNERSAAEHHRPFRAGSAEELLMQFGLTETQQMLKNSARAFFPAECPMSEVRRLMEIDGAHDDNLWRKIAEHGWTGIIFGEDV